MQTVWPQLYDLLKLGEQHGQMDLTTKSGYNVEYVSEQIISVIISNKFQMVLAPLYVKIAIIIKTLAPSLYVYLMNRRARKERKTQ